MRYKKIREEELKIKLVQIGLNRVIQQKFSAENCGSITIHLTP
jgi:hypothetical protein